MRILMLTLATSVVTAGVIMNAYSKKHQFYPSVTYILKSSRSMSVLYVQAFLMVWQLVTFCKFLFFGTLRAIEVEHLIERSWFAVLDTFILLAAFHEELSPTFVGLIMLVFIMKSFHCLASDRVDHMEQSPIISWKFHIRMVVLLLLLGAIDLIFISKAISIVMVRRRSVAIVFGLEYAIMMTEAVKVFMKYVLHTIDLRNENPWENKPIYLRYLDIVLGVIELLLYAGYMVFMILLPSIPLHIARRIYRAARDFHKSVYDVITSHQAIRNLNTLYPDVTQAELQAANNVCIICREEMVQRCKKLPCGHIFHTSCLRSWFQEQHTCPTCRLDVLRNTVPRPQQQQPQAPPQAPPPAAEGQNNNQPPAAPPIFPPMMGGGWPAPPPPPVPQGQPVGQQAPPGQTTPPAMPSNAQVPNVPPAAGGQHQFFMPPPVPMFFPPPPMMGPLNDEFFQSVLRSLTDDQLRELEGMERANVEARIVLLRNIQQLLDMAVLQMNQYSNVMASLNLPPVPGYPPQSQDTSGYPPQSQDTSGYPPQSQDTSGYPSSEPGQPEGGVSEGTRGLEDPSLEEPSATESQREDPGEEWEETPVAVTAGEDHLMIPDSEQLRQRRLQRFYSVPATLSSLAERKSETTEGEEQEEGQ